MPKAQQLGKVSPSTPSFPVVALGASAGGLAALRSFLSALPQECQNAAFVVAMHLDPLRKSALSDLLDGAGPLTAKEIVDGDVLTPGNLFVVPPGHAASIEGEKLRLTPRATSGRFTIDYLFRSMAQVLGPRVIGIVLSGSGSDGTDGLLQIQQHGGLTLAQDPAGLEHPEMPTHAILAGAADQILPADTLGTSLAKWLSDPALGRVQPSEDDHAVLQQILETLFQHTGADFSGYKAVPQERRIRRRQRLARGRSLKEYGERVASDLTEANHLRRDLLIRVTQFLRDPSSFKELSDLGLLELVRAWQGPSPLRVWIPACSTGEEAYTMVMLFFDLMQAEGIKVPIQIFATDVDPDSIRSARKGRYSDAITTQVPPAWLQSYFIRDEDGYRVRKSVRECIVFSAHDLLRDPPFSRIDLISCRNLLIYLTQSTQKRVIQTFHYSLNPAGLLFLGNAESVPTDSPLFEPLGTRARLYRRTDHPSRRPPRKYRIASEDRWVEGEAPSLGPSRIKPSDRLNIADATQVLVRHFTPPAALLDRQGEVLYFFEGASAFFQTQAGPSGLHALQLILEPLQAPLRSLLHEHRTQTSGEGSGPSATLRGSPVAIPLEGDDRQFVQIALQPVTDPPGSVLLVFEAVADPYDQGGKAGGPSLSPETREGGAVEALQEELRRSQLSLNHAIQDLERANTELRVSNEDLLSINEEVQSTNEELETSKEELESVNEELGIVNAELREKILELDRVNSDLQNLMASTQIATIFVDGAGRVLQYTPAATDIFRLIPSDRGRPLRDLSHSLALSSDALDAIIQQARQDDGEEVLATPRVQSEVSGPDGSVFAVQAFPYRATSGAVDGAVLNFIDLTPIRQLEADLRRLATSIDHFPIPFMIVDEGWKIISWNQGAQAVFGFEADEVIGGDYFNLVPDASREAERVRLEALRESQESKASRVTRQRKSGEIFPANNEVSWFMDGDRLLTTIADRDFSERVRLEEQAQLLVRELDHRVKNTLALVQGLLEYSSLTAGDSMETFLQAFRQRLQALANSQRALASGPGARAGLRELLHREIHSLGLGDRVHIQGPIVELRADLAFPMAMAVHELTTNAVRHGALASVGGEVQLHWSVDDDQILTLIWKETGGESVQPPEQTGFGTRLILEGLPYQTGGSSHVDYLETGIQWTLTVPL
jgi:two-component system CheB/CheR fusion protein